MDTPTAHNIKLLRQTFGMTQKVLAEKIGKSSNMISNYESGTTVQMLELARIARIFKTSTEQLESHKFTLDEAEALAREAGVITDTIENLTEDTAIGYGNIPLPNIPAARVASSYQDFTDEALAKHLGRIIGETLARHNTSVKDFAEKTLKRTPRTLERIIKGTIMADARTLILVAQEHGETMDIFRTEPLPLAVQLAFQMAHEMLAKQQKDMMEMMRKKH